MTATNYPPGVTGTEPQIIGSPEEDEMDTTTTRTSREVQGELYPLRAELNQLETTLKSARTRLMKAEWDAAAYNHLGPVAQAEADAKVARRRLTVTRHEARVEELTAQIATLDAEMEVIREAERAESNARREVWREKVQTVIDDVLADYMGGRITDEGGTLQPLPGVVMKPGYDGVEVRKDADEERGRAYEVTVRFPSKRWSSETLEPATLNWSAYGSVPLEVGRRYAELIRLAAVVASVATAAGLTDEWD